MNYEQKFQQILVQWLNLALPRTVFWTAIDASIGLPKDLARRTGAFKKSMGVRAGVPDLLFVYQGWALFIELKVDYYGGARGVVKGKLSRDQQQIQVEIMSAGSAFCVCRTISQVEQALRDFGIPLRGTSYQDVKIWGSAV